MRIVEIAVYQHDLVVAGSDYRMARSAVVSLDTTVVAITTETGLVGFGETCPLGPTYQPQHALGARAAIAEVAPALLGSDPTRLNPIRATMEAALNGSVYAKAAVEQACWDLTGKALGVPVHQLLGGAHRDRIPSYYGVMPGSVEERVAAASAHEAAGFGRLQIKVGAASVAEDIAAVREIAAAISPDTVLLADANGGWTMRQAINFSQACRDIALALEQPCATYEEHVSLRGRVAHPVFLDESADSVSRVIAAIEQGVADGFGMKGTRVGGPSAMRAVRDVCAARLVPITCDDTWAGDIGTAVTIHMGATVDPALFEGTWISQPYTASAYPMRTPPIDNADGWIDVPTGPGWGVEPDLEAWPHPIAAYRI